MPETTEIDLKLIRIDGGTQPRAQLNWIIVSEYAESIENGNVFPPIEVIYDGKDYWLWDGFHRIEAYRKAGCLSIRTNVRQGTRRDAVLLSVGANSSHGLRRTNDDKRRAVMTLLNDAEWSMLSDNEIAKHCGVSQPFASKLRSETLSYNGYKMEQERIVHRNGTTYTQNTANIGKAPTPPAMPVKQATLLPAAPVTQLSAIAPAMPVMQKPVAGIVINDAPIPIVTPSLADEIDPITAAEVNEEREEFTEAIPQVTLPIIDIINIDSQYIGSIGIEPVHLVVTSPPYNVGVDYDAYVDDISTYIELITAIWKECYKVMVDGARIAVVVPFGIGRNPYVPFDSQIMQTIVDAGFELRGRIVWDKNTTGNRTSWGSFRLPSDPGLRDTTECIIVAHKVQSKLDVPEDTKLRDEKGTHTAWLADSDEFMALAQDHWVIAPESAKRVGHPAPFPVKLAESLIKFYAYPGAHILDPFGGSGTVGIAAKSLGCNATIVELSAEYCDIARRRCNE